jgi:nitrate/nitrite transporter NarK
MPDATAATADPPKTSARFLVVGLAGLCAVLMYLDRVCISILGAYVPEDLGLTPQEWARALSMFFLAYALAQVPAGTLGDRFGPRTMLTLYVLLWSACTIWTGMATSLVVLLAARLACGLSQAGAYPTSGVLLKRWIPLRERGRASSFVSLGGRIGGALAPALTTIFIVALTPADISTRIAPADLLRPDQISKRLLAQGSEQTSELTEKIREHLSESQREAVQRLAAIAGPADKVAGRQGPHSPDGKIPDQADVDQLAGFLDSATTAPWLSDHLTAETLGLPGEATDILKLNRSDRSARQLAKLHRLALEAAFPGSLRQIYTPAWRRVLWLYGVIGLFVAVLFWWIVRDGPTQTSAKKSKGGKHADAAHAYWSALAEQTAPRKPRHSPLALLKLLGGSLNLWLFSFTQFGVNVGWAFLITLFPSYLVEEFQVPLELRGRMQTLLISVGCLGMVAGGFLSDSLVRVIGLRLARALPIGLALFVGAGLAASVCWAPSAWAAVAALSLMAAMVDFGVPSIWAFAQDTGGRHVGAVLGWGNMCGNLGAAASPILLTAIKESYGWNSAFAACAVSFALAGLTGLCLNATHPIERNAPDG